MQSDAQEAVPAASSSAPGSPLMFVLVFAVAVTLALLWIYLLIGWLYVIVAPDPWMDERGRKGIELVVFPLAWIAGLFLKRGFQPRLRTPYGPHRTVPAIARGGRAGSHRPAACAGVGRSSVVAGRGTLAGCNAHRRCRLRWQHPLSQADGRPGRSARLANPVWDRSRKLHLVSDRNVSDRKQRECFLVHPRGRSHRCAGIARIRGGGSEIPALFICLDPRCLELCADASPGGVWIPYGGGDRNLECPITESRRRVPAF